MYFQKQNDKGRNFHIQTTKSCAFLGTPLYFRSPKIEKFARKGIKRKPNFWEREECKKFPTAIWRDGVFLG